MASRKQSANTGSGAKAEPKLPEMMFVAAVYALTGWGLFSVGSCTVRGWNSIQSEGAEAQALMRAADERKAAEREGQVPEAVVKAGAMTAIQNLAVDPGSLQFRQVEVHRQASGATAVCGEFNAKNRAGGYNGFERFISAGTADQTWLEKDVPDFQSVWSSLCR